MNVRRTSKYEPPIRFPDLKRLACEHEEKTSELEEYR